MVKTAIVQIGCGTIGSALISQLSEIGQNSSLNHIGVFRSRTAIMNLEGLPINVVSDFSLSNMNSNSSLVTTHDGSTEKILQLIRAFEGRPILVDLTASAQTGDLYAEVLKKGGGVVSANKIPVSSSIDYWHDWIGYGGYLNSSMRIETTVGAGLPVLKTIAGLLETGDQITSIKGCFSGTLGFLFDGLCQSQKFSDVLNKARSKGMTEPDPREDLSGMDVARKIIILGRMVGLNCGLEDVEVENLIPDAYGQMRLQDFESNCHELNPIFETLVEQAESRGKILCYLGSVSSGSLKVRIEEVDKYSVFGSLSGPENICVIHSERYREPLVIRGPGAGPAVTAAGVLQDILDLNRFLNGSARG